MKLNTFKKSHTKHKNNESKSEHIKEWKSYTPKKEINERE